MSDAYWPNAFEFMFNFLTSVRGRPGDSDPPRLRYEMRDLYLRSIGLVIEHSDDETDMSAIEEADDKPIRD